jgi:predicted RNA methylase
MDETDFQWHFGMLHDTERNASFRSSLDYLVKTSSIVLDIGCGSGLLSMMAARAGAAQVIAVEVNHTIAACAKQVIADNNLSHVIRVEPVHSSQLKETKATLLVAEIVDSFLLGEGILPTFLHAKQYLLQETAEVIPCGAVVTACLIESPFLASLLPTGLNKIYLL